MENELNVMQEIVGEIASQCQSQPPEDDFFRELVEASYKRSLLKADVEFYLSERCGDDQSVYDILNDVWAECEIDAGEKVWSDKGNSALQNTPCLSGAVLKTLPELFKNGVGVFQDKRQKDVFFFSALSVVSSLLTNVTGVYAGEEVCPVMYSFIVAPAASGKSAMKYAAKLADLVHKKKKESSVEARKIYDIEKRDYDRKVKSAKGDPGDPPIEPKFEVHFIPGNSSSASILGHLEANGGAGLIVETESDSLSNTFASEWGNFSDMIRKGYHHEPIRSSRKTDGEYREIEAPCFSICLTGTPGQIPKLIRSAEDGMFSRMSFYIFSSPIKWMDVSPTGATVNFTEYFDQLSEQVLEMHEFYSAGKFTFTMSEKQWESHQIFFSQQLEQVAAIFGDESTSIVKRLGLLCFRTAMVLSAVSVFERREKERKIECSDTNFVNALEIMKVLLEHNLLLYGNLPKQKENEFQNVDYRDAFFDKLPNKIHRGEAVKLGEKEGFCERSVDGFLKVWLAENRLEKPRKGLYLKVAA